MPTHHDTPDPRDLTPGEVGQWLASRGHPGYRADQVLHWLYRKPVRSFDEMTNLPPGLRAELAGNFRLFFLRSKSRADSRDSSIKFAWELGDGEVIESVWIPDRSRKTLCVSTQSGCRMACRFCRTGQGGFRRQLVPSEIVGQVMAAAALAGGVTNLVLMGMGEPLDNLDAVGKALELLTDKRALAFPPRRITVSTIGPASRLPELAGRAPGVNLAVSLHSAVPETRRLLMPATRTHDLDLLRQALMSHARETGKKITIEVVLVSGVNDGRAEALALARFVSGFSAKVNIIGLNEWAGCEFKAPSRQSVMSFQEVLRSKGIPAYIRRSRGADVYAACGQLRADLG